MLRRDVRRAALLAALAAAAVCAVVFGVCLAAAGFGAHPGAGFAAGIVGFAAGAAAAAWGAGRVHRRAETAADRLNDTLRELLHAQKPLSLSDEVAYLPHTLRLQERLEQLEQTVHRAREGRAQADSMLDNMSEGLVALDHTLTIVMLNKRAAQFFQADSARMRGQNLLRLTHLPRLVEAATDAVREGKHTAFDWEDGEKGGTLQCSVSPVEGMAGSGQDGAVLLLTDVTAVRRTENIRSEFVANASHELKTPLTAIKGFVELMETDIVSDPAQVKSYLARIHAETQRMIELINDILRLSELESANVDAGFSTVSLKLIVQRAAESAGVLAKERGISVQVEGDVGTLQANPDRMMQLALNLMDNAVKYNKPGGSVTASVKEADGSVELCVRDTGVGIPPAAQARIFERFYRVDKGRSRRQGGTGLGLSIVKHIVELYKGAIRVESAVGKGTAVTVTLPAHVPDRKKG